MKNILLGSLGVLVLSNATAAAADVPVAAAPAAPCRATLSFPAYGASIQQNPNPACITVPGVGDVYVGGAITGYGFLQSNAFPPSATNLPSDRSGLADFSNLQAFVQKPDGAFQFYLQSGLYTVPTLGAPTFRTLDETRLLFGPVPVVYGKYAFTDEWSIQGGRLPTLIGGETTFTFQNLNIVRGLLFGQENAVNQGVQVNYAKGPLTISASGNDGFYSGQIDWLTGLVSYKLDDAQTLTFDAGANLGRSNVSTFATPVLQNNSAIFNIIYNYNHGPWNVTPYLQFTNVERDPRIGAAQGASTYGGAVLASYVFTGNFALAGRVEAESQTGTRGSGTTSLLYGPGSSAASVTVTPTFTYDRFVLRGEYSHTELYDIAKGDAAAGVTGSGFGRSGDKTGQDRFLVEGGVTF